MNWVLTKLGRVDALVVMLLGVGCHAAGPQAAIDANGHGDGAINDSAINDSAIHDGSIGTVSGASQAVCNPSPCGALTTTTYNLTNVSNDDGTVSNRTYQLLVPSNLNPSVSNRAPVWIDFSGAGTCGGGGAHSRIEELAPSKKFMVAHPAGLCAPSGSGYTPGWRRKTINGPHSVTVGALTAGATTATIQTSSLPIGYTTTDGLWSGWDCYLGSEPVPVSSVAGLTVTFGAAVAQSHPTGEVLVCRDDHPYVAALVGDLVTNHGADPARIYATGTSQGGNFILDIMCDATISPLFRGLFADSTIVSLYHNGVPTSAPSGGQPICPYINPKQFVGLATGTTGADACNATCLTHSWNQTDITLVADWFAGRLGCTSTRSDTTFGTPVAGNQAFKYPGACSWAVGGDAVYVLRAVGGGHTYCSQDSDSGALASCGVSPLPPTNGLFVAQQMVTFMEQSISAN